MRLLLHEYLNAPEIAPGRLGEQLDFLPRNVRETTRTPLGTYRGLRFGMVLNPQWAPEVYLEGATTRQDTLSRDHHGPRAFLNALERLAGAYGSECVRVQKDLSIAEAQFRDYQARLGKPFLHDAYLSEFTGLRDQLKAGLSSAAHQPDKEEGPSVSELAEKIKSLKAAHSIDATPQRARQKNSRIRPRRSRSPPASAGARRQLRCPIKRCRLIANWAKENPRSPHRQRVHPTNRRCRSMNVLRSSGNGRTPSQA
jgi:hypothetical protein